MSHTYTRNYIHLVFSTKERARTISKEVQPKLWAYMAGVCHHHKMASKAIGGIDDHVHLLFHLPPTLSLSKAVYLVKTNSSSWMKDYVEDFDWQQGYAAFSVSASNLEPVEKYIRNQGSYHKKIAFEQEYKALLKKHGIEFDPKYVLG
ncbi:MAG TPA: IS200/IS605 family transposase [Candidatus Angelobacter sp.]|nr:IS200/IS605 family transposase [Candidatus Angelobacter sp.]